MTLLDDVPEPQIAYCREGLKRLTLRETQILRQTIRGDTAQETANALGISRRTVELHRQQILMKLGAKNIVQAVRLIALAEA